VDGEIAGVGVAVLRVWWSSFGGEDEIMLSEGISSRLEGLIHPHIAVIVRGDGRRATGYPP
jgi:hypothetical protein